MYMYLCIVRLTGGWASYEGRLEVSHDGVWGTVCDDHFTDTEAKVFCNQLGYGSENILHSYYNYISALDCFWT